MFFGCAIKKTPLYLLCVPSCRSKNVGDKFKPTGYEKRSGTLLIMMMMMMMMVMMMITSIL